MRSTTALILFTIFAFACTSVKKAAPSAVGVVALRNYELNSKNTFTDTVSYQFITDANEFHNLFHLTKVSLVTAIVPDFKRQSVVAVILKPTTKVISVDINKAEIAGHNLNVYFTVTDTTSWKNYEHVPKAAATVPKSPDVKRVNFYRNNVKEKTLMVNQ